MSILALAMLAAWALIAGPLWFYDDIRTHQRLKMPITARLGSIFRAGPVIWIITAGVLLYLWGKRK